MRTKVRDMSNPATVKLMPLIYNVAFCKIAAQIQDALSATPLLPFPELNRLDKELLQWHTDLPAVFKSDASSVSGSHRSKSSNRSATQDILKLPSTIMHWRYQNLTFWLLHYVMGPKLHSQQRRKSALSVVKLLQLGRLQISVLCAAKICFLAGMVFGSC
jgi:hypothetical protein